MRFSAAFALIFFVFGSLLVVSSCTHNECKDVACLNDGICIDGNCECASGYSGDRCQIAPVDPCEGVVCNNASCVNGSCNCNWGYEGANCDTLWRDKFLVDNAEVVDDCTAPNSYEIDILPGDSITEIRLRFLRGDPSTYSNEVKAFLTSPTTFIIPYHEFQLSPGVTGGVSAGVGVLNGNQLTLSYSTGQGASWFHYMKDCIAHIQL